MYLNLNLNMTKTFYITVSCLVESDFTDFFAPSTISHYGSAN